VIFVSHKLLGFWPEQTHKSWTSEKAKRKRVPKRKKGKSNRKSIKVS